MKKIIKSTLAIASLLAFTACSDSSPKTTALAVQSGGGVSIDVIATNSWGTGYNGAIRITNTSFGSTITSVQLTFTLNSGASAGTAYEGSLTNSSGTYTYTSPSYLSLPVGQSKDYGFGGTGTLSSSTITGLKVNGQTITLGSGGTTTPTTPTTTTDTTAPTISLSSSASSVTAAGSITLTATASDNVGVASVEFFDGSTSLGTVTSSPYTKSVSFTASSSAQTGTKSYTAKAKDAAGNSKTSSAVSVSVNIPATSTPTTPTTSSFYVDPNSAAANWVKNNPNDSKNSVIKNKISTQASGKWFGGWSGDISSAVSSYVSAASSASKTPILVAYFIPGRDCGSYSAGGAADDATYKTWISNFSKAIGSKSAVVVLEPDALSQLKDCLSTTQQTARLSLISYAVDQFASNATNTKLYLDAGHAGWVDAAEMGSRLKSANIAKARGFALNTSNYGTNVDNTSYGNSIVSAMGNTARFVIDTSRNGNGSNGEWCNPAGRKLGSTSQVLSGSTGLEMYLWVKAPGESDGNCGVGSGSAAGDFLPQVAYDMAQ